MKTDYQKYEYFVGKIPPFLLLEMEYLSLSHIVENHKNDKFYSEINPASQVAFIGLLSYFEAFCKHQFAAVVNLFPSLILSFAQKRDAPQIEFSTLVSFSGQFEHQLGFLLAEKYDFGTAKSINGLFRDLLSISPFSKDEENAFNDIVYKRNLLVHHAGYYTLKSLGKSTISDELKTLAFREAVKIDTEDFEELSEFLMQMAAKIARQSVKVVRTFPEFIQLDQESNQFKAIEEMVQALYDTLEYD